MSLLSSLQASISNWLGLPPGVSPKSVVTSQSPTGKSFIDNEYVSTILDITVDDICIGENPLTVRYPVNIKPSYKDLFDALTTSINQFIKWIARDLCKTGVSVYRVYMNNVAQFGFVPVLRECEYYLHKDGSIMVYSEGTQMQDVIVFINYDKESLFELTESDKDINALFKVVPTPMQLKNADRVVKALTDTEDSILKYRKQLGRIARWINVDVGVSQGDKITEAVDAVSNAINANSVDLDIDDTYDDAIPVIPNRRGIGKPEIVTDAPSVEIKSLTDLEYILGKLNLVMRFPASYMDFSKELGESAVSMIRSDLRYAKLCSSVQSTILKCIYNFFSSNKEWADLGVEFHLNKYPTSEDDDVIEALSNYVDLSSKVEEFIGSEPQEMIHRLDLLQTLFNSCVVSQSLTSWFAEFRKQLLNKVLNDKATNTESESSF